VGAHYGDTGDVKRYSLSDGEGEVGDFDLEYEEELNDQQLEVVEAEGGPMLVIAGAGSGKTHTLTYRVARLVEEGVDPERILLVTFTNKAACSMTERVSALLGLEVRELWSGTFHSIANRILRREADRLGYSTDYTILDVEDAKTLMKNCRAEADVGHTERNFPKPQLLRSIHGYCINTQSTVEEVLEDRYEYFHHLAEPVRRVFRLYQSRKLEMDLMDFDDLLLNAKQLFRDYGDVRRSYADRFRHVLVDEYHDTNHIQGELVEQLSSEHENLMVVGDDCQSIYGFRGADFRNILEFPDRYPDCSEFKLEINYRSTPEILALANASIRYNEHQFHKRLEAVRPSGPKPALVKVSNREQQAQFVCRRLLELEDEGFSFQDVAVLYRSHYHSMELQMEMTRREIPFVVRSGLRFFEKAHIKDVLAHLKFVFNPKDELSFLRVAQLGRGIGSERSQQVWLYLSSQPDPLEALTDEKLAESLPGRAEASWRTIADRLEQARDLRMEPPGRIVEEILASGYEDYARGTFDNPSDRLDDLRQLADYAHGFPDLDRFLGEISLLTDVSGQGVLVGDDRDEFVTLSSVHQAKGLEWPAVFVLSVAEEQFPHSRSLDEEGGLEEERRLFYVATTRARDELYLCQPTRAPSRRGGRMEVQRASQFIREIRDDTDGAELPWEKWVVED